MDERTGGWGYGGDERRRRWPGEYAGEERRARSLADLETDQEPDQSPLIAAGERTDLIARTRTA
jgi:hypothetical protein